MPITKLKRKKIGPCRIQKVINDNAYVLDHPKDLDIIPIFNVADLHPFSVGTNEDPENEEEQCSKESNDCTKHILKKKREQIEQVLDTKMVATRSRA